MPIALSCGGAAMRFSEQVIFQVLFWATTTGEVDLNFNVLSRTTGNYVCAEHKQGDGTSDEISAPNKKGVSCASRVYTLSKIHKVPKTKKLFKRNEQF